MSSEIFSAELEIAILMMSLSGVIAWWAKNIFDSITLVRIFAILGSASALWALWLVW